MLCLLSIGIVTLPSGCANASPHQTRLPVTIKTLVSPGGRVDWSTATDLIAYDRTDTSGFYRVYTMRPDGTDQRCLTCSAPAPLPRRNQGNPAWHPSGKYLVIQAEKASHGGLAISATPGLGFYNDLWLISADGLHVWQLTNVSGKNQGVLHPHFSDDGSLLSWSEIQTSPKIDASLKVADFSFNAAGPHLSNIRSYEPRGAAFYESHGFSKDSKTLFFSGGGTLGSLITRNDIYAFNLTTDKLSVLTSQGYNEHATVSPNGQYISWMSNNGNLLKGTDLWRMNLDGSGKVRLTAFNIPGYPESGTLPVYVADNSWSPDSTRIVAYVQDNLIKQTGKIVMITILPSTSTLTPAKP